MINEVILKSYTFGIGVKRVIVKRPYFRPGVVFLKDSKAKNQQFVNLKAYCQAKVQSPKVQAWSVYTCWCCLSSSIILELWIFTYLDVCSIGCSNGCSPYNSSSHFTAWSFLSNSYSLKDRLIHLTVQSRTVQECQLYTSQSCPKSNLIKDKIPVLGLDIVECQVQFKF